MCAPPAGLGVGAILQSVKTASMVRVSVLGSVAATRGGLPQTAMCREWSPMEAMCSCALGNVLITCCFQTAGLVHQAAPHRLCSTGASTRGQVVLLRQAETGGKSLARQGLLLRFCMIHLYSVVQSSDSSTCPVEHFYEEMVRGPLLLAKTSEKLALQVLKVTATVSNGNLL